MRRARIAIGILSGLVLGCAVLGLAAPRARAETGLTPAQAEAARVWRGRFCTPSGCGPAPATNAASVAAFGLAALGAGWVSRRRGRAPR